MHSNLDKTDYIDTGCTLSLGNCIEKMGKINDRSIDLVLTDPPYNLGLFMKNRETNLGALRENHFSASTWDNLDQKEWEVNINLFMKESSRILKERGALLIFVSLIKIETIVSLAEKNGFYYKTTGIWHKTNPLPRNKNLHFVNSTEAWVYFINKGKTGTFNNDNKLIHDFYESSVIGLNEKKFGKHPTQKPIKLMEHFINILSNRGETVLDPFMGSGSTGVAAMANNRQFYGIEIDESYFQIALKRISNVLDNRKLL